MYRKTFNIPEKNYLCSLLIHIYMSKMTQEDPHLVNQIKSGTFIEGIVKASGDIRIDGTLKGTLQTEGKLVIGPSGQVDGEIVCQNAEIHGVVNGKITVNELLSLKASCKFLGDLIVGRLSIEPGAQFSGSCVMGNVVKGLYNGQEPTKERAERQPQAVS
jgi:cytoskeletal protein CcmA (bactofilin family)